MQADLKTWAALGAYGMSAITAVTAQNSERVAAVHYLPPDFVAAQIDAVLSDYGAAAIKTGFLGRVEIIEAVADRLSYWRDALPRRPSIVIDPVLVNHRGEAMFDPEVAAAYREWLFPLADLVTPNRVEAGLLGIVERGRKGEGEQGCGGAEEQGSGGAEEQRSGGADLPISSAPHLPTSSAPRLLLKGWRVDAADIVDRVWDGRAWSALSQPRIDTTNLHGSGDTLSAAICAFLALGHEWPEAIRRAGAFTHEAIRRGASWRLGRGHGPLGH